MSSRKSQDRDLPKAKLSKESLKRSLRLFRYMSSKDRWLFGLGTLFLGITAGASILFPKLEFLFMVKMVSLKHLINPN
jgi:hypothetical protein